MVKLHGVHQWLLRDVIQCLERWGFKLVGVQVLQGPERFPAEQHHDFQRKPLFPALISYLTPTLWEPWSGKAQRSTPRGTDLNEAPWHHEGGPHRPHQQECHLCQ